MFFFFWDKCLYKTKLPCQGCYQDTYYNLDSDPIYCPQCNSCTLGICERNQFLIGEECELGVSIIEEKCEIDGHYIWTNSSFMETNDTTNGTLMAHCTGGRSNKNFKILPTFLFF